MLHAAYAPVGTAIGRLVRLIPDPPFGGGGPFLSLILLLGIIGILASDKIRYGRVHLANWLGLIFYILTVPLSLSVANSNWYARLSLG